MAKKKIHIDELFRRELGDMKMPVDTNDWATMQAQIAAEQKKRKRRAIWWWFAGIALLLAGSFATYSLVSSDSATTSANNTEVSKPSIPNTETPEKNGAELSDSKGITEKTSDTESTSTETTTETKQANSSSASEGKTNSTGKTTPSNNNTPTDKGENNTGNVDDGNNKQTGETDNSTTDNELNTPTLTDTPYAVPNKTAQPNDSDDKDKPEQAKVNEGDTNNSEQTKKDKKDDKEKKGNTPDKETDSPSSSLGLNLGILSSNFIIQDNSQWGKILNNSSATVTGVEGRFLYNKNFGKIELSTGLGFSHLVNNASYNYTHQTYDSVPVLNPQGQIIGYFYTNFRDTSHNFILQNSFTTVSLPIGITYTLPLNSTSGLRFGANTSISYLVNAGGEYINPYNLFKMDVSQNQDLYRKWNIGLGASVGYYYTLNKLLSVEGTLSYSTLANSIFDNKKVGTAIRPSNIGFSVGLRYHLKTKK